MSKSIFRRLISAFSVLPLALLLVFLLLRITGNPIENAFGDRLSPEELERRIKLAGLDRPLHEQFLTYMQGLLSGDFGKTVDGRYVGPEIWKHLAASAEVVSLGLVLLFVVILVFGGWAARKPNSLVDRSVWLGSIITYALPGFLGAVALKELARMVFPEFQNVGRLSITNQIYWQGKYPGEKFVLIPALFNGEIEIFFDAFSRLILPALALCLIAGTLVRVYRDALAEQLQSEPIKSALHRGITKSRVYARQAFPASLPPLLANFGITASSVLTGVVFIESVFEIRGLGFLLVDSVLKRDFMLVQGIFTVSFLIVVVINFVIDLAVVSIDRRRSEQLL